MNACTEVFQNCPCLTVFILFPKVPENIVTNKTRPNCSFPLVLYCDELMSSNYAFSTAQVSQWAREHQGRGHRDSGQDEQSPRQRRQQNEGHRPDGAAEEGQSHLGKNGRSAQRKTNRPWPALRQNLGRTRGEEALGLQANHFDINVLTSMHKIVCKSVLVFVFKLF